MPLVSRTFGGSCAEVVISRRLLVAELGDAVGHQVGADGEQTDHEHRREHGPGLGREAEPVLVDHLPPVGGTGVGREAQEAEGGDEADRVGQPQAGLGEQRGVHVGQHLGHDHAGALLAQRLGGVDEVARDEAQRDAAGEPGDAGCVREARRGGRSSTPSAWSTEVRTSRASRICGKASVTSLSRMITSSHQPPQYAAMTPMRVPTTMPRMVLSTAIDQDLGAAVHQPGEDVLAEVVGAEDARGAERRAGDLVLAVRRELRSEQGEQHDDAA